MALLEELKNYLDITWEDDNVDLKLTGILTRAENIISGYAGEVIDFGGADGADGIEREKQLLFDCCRYIYNNAFEDFKENFSSELLMLRAEYNVRRNESAKEEVS